MREAYVISLAESAGFRFAERSAINANPKDTKDHPAGYERCLRLSLGDQDREKYRAMSESDRMTLKFIKP
jgi:predicted methyltransferase